MDGELSTKRTEWVATIVVAGSVLGALVGGRIANAIGRKPTMVVVAVTYAVFAVLSGIAPSLTFLDIARFFLGVTIGISIVTAPIFVAESAPAAVRGGMIVMYQVATVTGIVIAYFVDYALAGAEAWRWMLALSAVPSLLVLVGSLVATLVSLSIVDRLGRRPTLLTGIGAMVAATLLLVVVFAAGDLN